MDAKINPTLAGTDAQVDAEAARALQAGAPIIVVAPTLSAGGRGRGRGAMVGLAALASAGLVNTMITWGRGLVCFSATAEQAMALGLGLSAALREDAPGPIFLRSVEAASCDGTGISAEDRALTLRAAGGAEAGPGDLKSPGHVMPAIAGYAERPGIADIALRVTRRLAGDAIPAWTDILDDSGEVADLAYCRALAAKLSLVCVDAGELAGGNA